LARIFSDLLATLWQAGRYPARWKPTPAHADERLPLAGRFDAM
jgi:hypothetical protein